MSEFSELVKNLRKDAGFTQVQLAEKAKMAQATVPHGTTIRKIAQAIGIQSFPLYAARKRDREREDVGMERRGRLL